MAKIFVYDAYTNRMLTYNLTENDVMPYAYGTSLRVKEFRGSSNSAVLWTTTAAMEAWNLTRRSYGNGTTAGYPTLRRGCTNTYVLILQDALNALGYVCGSLDGKFGARTENALKAYQKRVGLTNDGVCGCNTWKKLSAAVVGIGRTKTVLD